MDGSRPALAISWLPRAAYECAPAPPARSLGGDTCRHYQARRCSYPAAQLCHPSLRTKDRYPGHPGAARTQEARYDGALHPRRHQRDWRGDEPTRSPAEDARLSAAVAAVGGRGGGHLPSSRAGLAWRPGRPCEPRPTEGDVGDRALTNGAGGPSCLTLRILAPTAHLF